ncbi:maleylpyruvate isomerase family mycothiol-dependent enzyme [Nonomuraea sp. NN258]|uniref:maleylpyruvate isomerase family mycothiol-dependent enzyme n=1 Tax=Nonomuraea antri TaxID=2730852 RepID=UPI0015683263|nr:maleylpyruvate isomerase family mycothiol-dependent enzyme [Nonomuraea antri]NRQ33190.1 maleylpyruvate isomerase family mycothiol-dependent enzyme [Nonomuraea antri]
MTRTEHRAGRRAGDVWPLIHAERAALAADLAGLDDGRWATPSLCAGLSVREVLAHVASGAGLRPLRWLAGVIRCRFDFDKQVAMRLAEQLGDSGAETLERFERVITSTTSTLLPAVAMLGEVVVHGEDIRRPLGLRRAHPVTTLTPLARYYAGPNILVPGKERIAGLRVAAADGPFAAGSGPLVTGSTLALVMVMAGRPAYLDELDGDGVDTLRARLVS